MRQVPPIRRRQIDPGVGRLPHLLHPLDFRRILAAGLRQAERGGKIEIENLGPGAVDAAGHDAVAAVVVEAGQRPRRRLPLPPLALARSTK